MVKMRSFFYCLLFLSFVSCQSKTEVHEEPALDSLSWDLDTTQKARADTSVFAGSQYDELARAIDSLINKKGIDAAYILNLNASGYEYKTESVWEFDSLFNLIRAYQNWASEGQEGKSHVFFLADKVYALRDEQSNGSETQVDLYHEDLGGISYVDNGEPVSDAAVSPLKPETARETRDDLRKQLQSVLRLLRENEKAIRGKDEATLVVESESQNGDVSAKDRTEIKMDRKLLEKLLE